MMRPPISLLSSLTLVSAIAAQDKPAADAEAIQRSRQSVVDRILAFSDREEAIRSLSRIAAVVCEVDRREAADLFWRAGALLQTLEPLAATEAPDRPMAERRRTLRTTVLDAAQRCDASVRKQLAEAIRETDSERESVQSRSALLDARRAMEEASTEGPALLEKAIGLDLSDHALVRLVYLLKQMQLANPEEATRLFLSALQTLRSRQGASARDLLILGDFAFSTNHAADAPMSALGSVAGVMVYILTTLRPGVPEALVTAYLDAAAEILSRPPVAVEERSYMIAAALQLLPLTRRYLPSHSSRVDGALQVLLAQGARPALSRLEDDVANDAPDSDGKLEEAKIQELPGAVARDRRFGYLIQRMAIRGNYRRARELTARVSDPQIRSSLEQQLIYAEGADLLQRGKTDAAQMEAEKLIRGAGRCRLLLGVARVKALKHPPKQTDGNVWHCLADLKEVSPDERPALQVAAAEILGHTDSAAGLSTLLQAVEGYNLAASRRAAVADKQKDQPVTKAESPQIYAQPVPLGDFEEAIPLLMRSDADGTEAAVATLQSEPLLGRRLATVLAVRQGHRRAARFRP